MSPPREPIRHRLKRVRLDARMTQVEWSARLNELARALFGDEAPRYRQGVITKLETGMQAASFDDVEVYAAADPKQRGKLWLGWNEPPQARPAPDPRFTTGEMAPVEVDYGEDAIEQARSVAHEKTAPSKGGRVRNDR